MAVYYRYKSGVQTFSVPVAVPFISVADLKRLILGTPRHGHGHTRARGAREGVALSDPRTGEEYADDCALIPRSSTVVVRRVVGPPAETITVASSPSPPKATQDDTPSDSTVRPRSSSSAEADEGSAISAVIDAAKLKWEDHRPSQGARCYGRRGAAEGRAPPAGYVCHRCRVPGHFIQHCPTNGDPRFDLGRASSAATLPAPAPVSLSSPDDGIPPELHCKICQKVMADAVVATRCCFGSFCDGCIRGHIAAKSKCVCGGQARADDLIPNATLRATIANLLATSATGSGSGGTEKPRSSSGSNAEPTSQNPAASQESRSHVSAAAGPEHSDGSASSTSKGAAHLPAAREQRSRHATAESAEVSARAGFGEQYSYGVPVGPGCYDPFFGGVPWASDPYMMMYYGVPHGGGYPTAPAPAGYHDGRHGRKSTADGEYRERDEHGFKRRCGNRSLVAV